MITLFRKANCGYCNDIEEELKELVIAHSVINIEEDAACIDKNHLDISIPFIEDDGKIISGSKEIKSYLEELNKFVSLWRKYQTDACYIDDDEKTC